MAAEDDVAGALCPLDQARTFKLRVPLEGLELLWVTESPPGSVDAMSWIVQYPVIPP